MPPVTPSPSTTEWVPLWDLNGGGSGAAAHHTTHETGGTDEITSVSASIITSGTIPDPRLSSNVALKNAPNIFSASQAIYTPSAGITLSAINQPLNARVWRIIDIGSLLFQATDDPISVQQGAVSIDRTGVLFASAGLGGTPLNGSQVTAGTIPDARLSSNVALKNIDNQFVAQTLASLSIINGTSSVLYFKDTSAGVDQKFFRILNDGVGDLYVQSMNDPLTIALQSWTFVKSGVFTSPGGLGPTPLNASSLVSGTVPPDRYITYGYWMPVLGGVNGESGQIYNYQQGYWMRVGKLMHLWSYTQFKGPLDGGTTDAQGTILGNLVLKGFPVPIGNPAANPINGQFAPFVAGIVAYYSNLFTPQDITGLALRGSPGSSFAYLLKHRSNGQNPIEMANTDVNNASQLIAHITYFTD